MFRRARGNYRNIPPRRSGPPAPPVTPSTIITSVPVTHWYRADLGVTVGAGGVTTWEDQIGTAHLLQFNSTRQPLYNAADPTFNNQATIESDGTNDALVSATIDFSGGPFFCATVIKLITPSGLSSPIYATPGGFTGDGSYLQLHNGNIYQSGPSTNANARNAGLVIGQWARFFDRRANNAGDYIKIGNLSQATGLACPLSVGPGPWGIMGATLAAVYLAAAYREIVTCAGEPTPAELTALEAYFQSQGPLLV